MRLVDRAGGLPGIRWHRGTVLLARGANSTRVRPIVQFDLWKPPVDTMAGLPALVALPLKAGISVACTQARCGPEAGMTF